MKMISFYQEEYIMIKTYTVDYSNLFQQGLNFSKQFIYFFNE